MSVNNRIGRTITVMVCECVVIEGHNKPRDVTVKLYGDYADSDRAQSAVARKLGTKRVLLKSWRKESFYASMPINEFVEHATITKKQPREMEIENV